MTLWSSRLLWTLSGLSYYTLVVLTFVATFLSCISLLSQAVRTTDHRTWGRGNYNTVVIGAAYSLVFLASVILFVNRRIAVRFRLQRISKSYKTVRKGDVPKVHPTPARHYIVSLVLFSSACAYLYYAGICSLLPDFPRIAASTRLSSRLGPPWYVYCSSSFSLN